MCAGEAALPFLQTILDSTCECIFDFYVKRLVLCQRSLRKVYDLRLHKHFLSLECNVITSNVKFLSYYLTNVIIDYEVNYS